MWATKSKWSHTAIFIEIWGQPYVIEAQRNGVNVKSYYEWLKKYGYYFEISRSPYLSDHKLFSINAMSVVGVTGYDFVSLLVRYPWKIITGAWRKKKVESDKFYCSEYAMWTHDVELSYRMSPQDVYEYCEMDGWEVII